MSRSDDRSPRAGGSTASGAPRDPLDLRLIPAAAGCWIAAGWGVGASAAQVVGVGAGVGFGAVVFHLVQRRRGRRMPGWGWLAIAACVIVAASVAVRVVVRESSQVAQLVEAGRTVTLVGRVVAEPRAAAHSRIAWSCELALMVQEQLPPGQMSQANRGQGRSIGGGIVILAPAGTPRPQVGAVLEVVGVARPARSGSAELAVMFAREVAVRAPPSGYRGEVATWRAGIARLAADHADAGALLAGMAIGDTSGMSTELDDAMRRSSLTHLTAVSGAHVAIVLATMGAVAALVTRSRWARVGVAGLGLAGFVALVGAAPSVLRATAMGSLALMAMLLGRRRLALPALAAAVMLLLAWDPWLARDFGFALSVAATAGLVVLAPRWAARLRPIVGRPFAFALAIPAAAQVTCSPLLVIISGQLPVLGVAANLVSAPAVPVATISGLLATIAARFDPEIAGWLAQPGLAACGYLAAVARATAAHPWAALAWPASFAGCVGVIVVELLAVGLVSRILRRGRRAACAAASILVIACGLVAVPGVWGQVRGLVREGAPADWAVAACDVGQGTAWAIRTGEDSALLVDTGPAGGGVDTCLADLGVRHLDAIVISHLHDDHVADLDAAMRQRSVGLIVFSAHCASGDDAQRLIKAARQRGVEALSLEADNAVLRDRAEYSSWAVVPPAALRCGASNRDGGGAGESVGHAGGGTAVNDGSLVVVAATRVGVVVTLGDLEIEGQRRARAALRQLDAPDLENAGSPGSSTQGSTSDLSGGTGVAVLSVAHHGSARQLDSLARELSPRIAIASAGADNDYGHPAPSAMELYRGVGAITLSTHECGTIVVAGTPEAMRWHAGCGAETTQP